MVDDLVINVLYDICGNWFNIIYYLIFLKGYIDYNLRIWICNFLNNWVKICVCVIYSFRYIVLSYMEVWICYYFDYYIYFIGF